MNISVCPLALCKCHFKESSKHRIKLCQTCQTKKHTQQEEQVKCFERKTYLRQRNVLANFKNSRFDNAKLAHRNG